MFFQVYRFKNAGVAGYAEAFGMVQLGKQACYMGSYLEIGVLGCVFNIIYRTQVRSEEILWIYELAVLLVEKGKKL